MNTQSKKNEILNDVFKSKDGLTWNELTEHLNELIVISKERSFVKLSDCKPEISGNIACVNGMLLMQVKELFAKLTDDERMEVISDYCKYCGRDDNGCQCWNDD